MTTINTTTNATQSNPATLAATANTGTDTAPAEKVDPEAEKLHQVSEFIADAVRTYRDPFSGVAEQTRRYRRTQMRSQAEFRADLDAQNDIARSAATRLAQFTGQRDQSQGFQQSFAQGNGFKVGHMFVRA